MNKIRKTARDEGGRRPGSGREESKRYSLLFVLLVVVALLASAASMPPGAQAGVAFSPQAAGDLDPTFSTDGKVTTDFPGSSDDLAAAVVRQADGKLVVAGPTEHGAGSDFAVARYNTDGTLDTTFGTGGKVTTDFANSTDSARAVALQVDGKIVVAGSAFVDGSNDFALARYNADGILDNTFDGDGKATTDFFDRRDSAWAVAIQGDGKIVAAGSAEISSFNSDIALARYNADGILDNTFDGDGKLNTDFDSGEDAAEAVAIQADGKIVVAGSSATGDEEFTLVRYNTNGSLDNTFDGDGKVTTFNNDGAAYSLAIQGDGKIVAAGYISNFYTTGHDFALARYNANGTLDTTFDGDGMATTAISEEADERAYAVAIQGDGKIVAAGSARDYVPSSTEYETDFALTRYNANGTLDNTFSSDGKIITDFGGPLDFAEDIAIQGDGKIVAVGLATNSNTFGDFALVRYDTGGALDGTFDTDGKLSTDFIGPTGSQGNAMALQVDGKIVVAGSIENAVGEDFVLARYNTDGTLDTSFGTGGRVVVDFFGYDDVAEAVAVQADGKIVVAGSAETTSRDFDFGLVRYNTDGTLDNTFDGDGKLTTDVLREDYARDVAIQGDGKIVVAGYSFTGVSFTDFSLARYNTNGTPDTTFSGDGKVNTNFLETERAEALAIQGDGKIVAVGWASSDDLGDDFALARYNADGTLDNAFDGDGKATTDFSGDEAAYAMALQPDGKIVAAGFSYTDPLDEDDFAIARYNSNGTLDTGFSGDGKITTDFDNETEHVRALAIQENGKIVAAGYVQFGFYNYAFALARYNVDGTPDTTFNGDGELSTDFFDLEDKANDMVIQGDGKIVTAGFAYLSTTGHDLALARYDGDSVSATPTVVPATNTAIITTPTSTSTATSAPSTTATHTAAAGTQTPGPTQTNTATAIPASSSTATVAATLTSTGASTATSTSQATPTAGTTCPMSYSDVQSGDTFYSFIHCLTCDGAISGYPDGTFKEGNPITRGQIAKVVSNAAGFSEDPGPQIYSDVPPGSTHYDYINRLTNRGIVGGYPCPTRPDGGDECTPQSPNLFKPNEHATRGQMAKIVSNAVGFSEAVSGQHYADVLPTGEGSQFYTWIMRLTNRDVMGGYACGASDTRSGPCDDQDHPYFRPANSVTRGQAAKIVANTFFPGCQAQAQTRK